jgi:hypothetical protein
MEMTKKRRPAADAILGSRLIDILVDAALDEQNMRGRGVLCVKPDSTGLMWTYKAAGECAEEIREWTELERLLSGYDADSEVVIALFNEGAEFFRLPADRSSV